ncbi:MAG: hypothetical protein FJ390_06160 [Verrucomicrobia bacterium]|nr:hypothetical protein [Verrucomicrobiota bacterium]
MIAVQIDTKNRLHNLAKKPKVSHSKISYLRNVLLDRLEDLEDICVVTYRLLRPCKKTYSSEEVKHELGL